MTDFVTKSYHFLKVTFVTHQQKTSAVEKLDKGLFNLKGNFLDISAIFASKSKLLKIMI